MAFKNTKKPTTSTKKHLKTMSQKGKSYRIRTAKRIVSYGAISFGRNIWLSIAASLVMTITLLILFVTVIASGILTSTADSMKDKIDITIFFKPTTTQESLDSMKSIMESNPNVKTVEVANSEQEYQKFLEENQGNSEITSTLKDSEMKNIILNTMQATMRLKVYDTENIQPIEDIVKTNPEFNTNLDTEKAPTYDVNRTEIETVTSWANIAKNGGLALGAVFLGISILVIFNTIRMAIFSRREEIYMMKLVGADNSFIRGPFLVEAQISGVISGVVAATLGFVAYKSFGPRITDYGIDISQISHYLDTSWLVAIYVIMIGIGMLIGSISARLAIHKYLNK